jgi:O-antigen/teichoic acid export membrane protein
VSPVVILAGVIVAFGVNMALSYFVGFRPGRTHRPTEDAVVGMGLSILLSFSCSSGWTGSGPGHRRRTRWA